MLKKLTILAAALAVSAPAFADRGHREHRGHDRHDRRVVVHKHALCAAPAGPRWSTTTTARHRARSTWCVTRRRPRSCTTSSHSNAGAALLVGAILGGAIVHSVITGGY